METLYKSSKCVQDVVSKIGYIGNNNNFAAAELQTNKNNNDNCNVILIPTLDAWGTSARISISKRSQ